MIDEFFHVFVLIYICVQLTIISWRVKK